MRKKKGIGFEFYDKKYGLPEQMLNALLFITQTGFDPSYIHMRLGSVMSPETRDFDYW